MPRECSTGRPSESRGVVRTITVADRDKETVIAAALGTDPESVASAVDLCYVDSDGRMIHFGRALPALRSQIDKDLRRHGVTRERVLFQYWDDEGRRQRVDSAERVVLALLEEHIAEK